MQRAFLMIVLISTVMIYADAQDANKQDPRTRLWLGVNKELTFLMPGGKDPEVTLRIRDVQGKYDNFPGPLKLGSRISFEAIAVSFVKQPFMLVLDFMMAQRL
jgi:hypothetical protein